MNVCECCEDTYKPKIINYLHYGNFSESEYGQEILFELLLLGNIWVEVSFETFLIIYQETLDKTAPIKQK